MMALNAAKLLYSIFIIINEVLECTCQHTHIAKQTFMRHMILIEEAILLDISTPLQTSK